MPRYLIYSRHKNKKIGLLLFKGEPIEAANEESALHRACRRDVRLRRSRLFAKLVKELTPIPPKTNIEVVMPEPIEPLTPAEMKQVLGGSDV